MKQINISCVIAYGVVVLLLAGCQEEQNPLLGDWSLVKTAELNSVAFQMAKLSGNAQITFKKDQMTSGEQAIEVSYSVDGKEVTVHYVNGEANTYVVEGDEYFMFEIPKVGKFRYERVKGKKLL